MNDRLASMRRCHPDSIKASRIAGSLFWAVLIALSVAYIFFAPIKGWTVLPGWIGLGLFILALIWFTWIEPVLSYRMFGFKVTEEELELRSGWLWLSDTIVPMTRVQHVELERGPLLRRFGLAEVKVVTAAKTHVIKALESNEAEELKKQIGELAKVVDHDE
ncbi:PH domain-containing protein [Paenibacillus faecalis]|uniref:PH domain-containing protein n=1 Tax=Paenibacillus faecalis TaxID=2079532 RepID=UPI000D0F4500|nr:PH domain-containing protein [Paenibacillus faecalis]